MAAPNPMPVPFYGNTLYVLDHDGEPFVPMRPIVESMGMDWNTQYRKINGNSERWGAVVIMTTIGADKKRRELVSIPCASCPAD